MRGNVVDATGGSIVQVSGREGLDLLQRISTNDLTPLRSGQHVQTILTNDKGRIVDVVTVIPNGAERLLLVGGNPASTALSSWIDKFIIMEDITVTDITPQYFNLTVFGLEDDSQGIQLQAGVYCIREKWRSRFLVRLIGNAEIRDSVLVYLGENGIDQEQQEVFERYRIENGIPAFPSELSASYNPLEAGMDGLVSWTKGCYVGQEVIARLDTYKKVQRRLVKLRLDRIPEVLPAVLLCRSVDVGLITSASVNADGSAIAGLGYLKVGYLQNRGELSFEHGTDIVHATIVDS